MEPDAVGRRVAIVDYGLGNLFSIRQACLRVGLQAEITADRGAIESADGVILPGVGAFADAMRSLDRLRLVQPLRDLTDSGACLLGVCLGMQLLLTRSHEFGVHEGLGIVPGQVVRLPDTTFEGRRLKIPHTGWNRIYGPPSTGPGAWLGSPLEGLEQGEFVYFVHSYMVVPEDDDILLASSTYGDTEFCAGLRQGNVFAVQFHPEKSGPSGLRMYENFAHLIREQSRG